MRPERLPHLRVRRVFSGAYRNPRGFGPERRIPDRNPAAHARALLANIKAVEQELGQLRQTVHRPAEAEGHLVTAEALADTDLAADSLGDKRVEAVVVAETADRAIVHLRRDDLSPLRRKIGDYGNPQKRTQRGRPRNEALVAPLEGLRVATLADLSEGTLTEATVEGGETYWVELWARGGRLEGDVVRARVREEISWLAREYGVPENRLRTFRATERDVYLLPLPGRALHELPVRVPDVYRVVPATPALRDLIVTENEAEFVQPDEVRGPSDDSPAVVVLDTGVAPEHPLLAPALVSPGHSVVVGDPSPVDSHGHGTEMAGLASYSDLGSQLLAGGVVEPRARLQNVRLLAHDQQSDEDREFWPERTEEAVRAAEDEGPERRVFNLCVSAQNRDPGARTSWSVGLDLLAHNEGRGRLFCVAAGNVQPSPQRDDYPNLNLVSSIDDPAQALNVITVGAITDRSAIPIDDVHGALVALAEEGELSPYARSGVGGVSPIKPEIVFEGGNCAPDGQLPNVGIDSLSILTTDRAHAQGRILTFTHATSAACAATSGLVAEVWRANSALKPWTIRALAVHSARWTPAILAQFPDRRVRIAAVGYGTPDIDIASFSTRSRPTVVVEDELRPGGFDAEGHRVREHHLIQLPLPSDELLALGEHEVELSVTLSYFVEPNESSRTNYAGANLRWDIQRQGESEEAFRQRINRLARGDDYVQEGVQYPWEIGPELRGRGSVQSDRCRLPAAALAGERVLAVFPALGWWEARRDRDEAAVPYGLVVTIDAGDAAIDLYALIEARIAVEVPAV